MKAIFFGTLALATALSGCSTLSGGGAAASGAEVTRFHLGQPIARGAIAVEAFEPADANSPEFRSYAISVGQELTRLGWTVSNAATTEQVALIDVTQGAVPRMRVGAVPGTVNPNQSTATQLEVRIKRRSDGTVFWEGRAVDDRRGAVNAGQRVASVQRLATALFRDFPGESGRTISAR